MKSETKKCQNCQKDFTIESEDFAFYEKMKVPAPTLCPQCRVERRMSFYNVRTLYRRTCDKCQQNTLSIYQKDTEFPVYCPKCWWADDWDASEYSLDYDFSKTFFENFKELFKIVPRVSLKIDYLHSVNSPYANGSGALKNSYLVFVASDCENTKFTSNANDLKDSMDCTNVSFSENSYSLFNCNRIYNSSFLVNCNDSLNINFSKNLRNCQDCFGCVNLSNASYQIFNKQYSKEEYQKKIKEFDSGSYQNIIKIKSKTEKIFLQAPVKYLIGIKNNNVSGNYIWKSKNVQNSYGIDSGENLKYCQMLEMPPTKDCYDYTNWGQNAENIYEVINAGENINKIKFTSGAWYSHNIEYSDNALHSNDLFGCIFLRKKSYCIFNKQYSKEEYFEMVKKIKEKMKADGEYGEFFPVELSPFAYNETIAQEYFPLTKEEALKKGYKWKEREERNYQIDIKPEDLPDNIKDVDNDITKKVIGCSTKKENQELTNCTEAFKIIPSELEFYKKMNLPLPRYCPNCRHHHRLKNRNPLKLYKRTCMKEGCNNEFETTYSPEREEIVYCERCYQEETI